MGTPSICLSICLSDCLGRTGTSVRAGNAYCSSGAPGVSFIPGASHRADQFDVSSFKRQLTGEDALDLDLEGIVPLFRSQLHERIEGSALVLVDQRHPTTIRVDEVHGRAQQHGVEALIDQRRVHGVDVRDEVDHLGVLVGHYLPREPEAVILLPH